MKIKIRLAVAIGVLAMGAMAFGQGWTAGSFSNPVATNFYVGASDCAFTSTVNFAAISFCNDSTNTIYMAPGTNAVAVGKGIRLNNGGGTVFFDANGKPTQKVFHFIATQATSNNVSILIGGNQ